MRAPLPGDNVVDLTTQGVLVCPSRTLMQTPEKQSTILIV